MLERPRSDFHAKEFAGLIRTRDSDGSSRSPDHIDNSARRRWNHGHTVRNSDLAFSDSDFALNDWDDGNHTFTVDYNDSEPDHYHYPESKYDDNPEPDWNNNAQRRLS